MQNRFARIFLGLAGLVFAGTGATFVFAPGLVPALATHPNASADAINDVRVVYGAMELAYGAFLALCASRPRLYEAGYLAAILLGGLAAAARVVGFVVLEGTPVAHLAYGALDLFGAGVAVIGWRRLRRAEE